MSTTVVPEDEAVRAWLADYVYEKMRTDSLEQVAERLNSAIIARVPELADRDMRRDLAASTRAHIRAMLPGLTSDTVEFAIPEQAHALARTIARRGFELRLLLRVYHVGHEAVLDFLTDAIDQREAPYEVERRVLLRVFERSSKWVGASVELLTDTYMAEREQVFRAALNRRTETVHALLADLDTAGAPVDTEQASIQLGYRLGGQHLAFVLWTDEPGGEIPGEDEAIGLLDRTATRLTTALGATGALTVPSGASGMWAWAALEDTAQAARLAVPGALSRLAEQIDAPVRVAFGVPGGNVEGFRASHREAVAARQVAERASTGGPRVRAYRDVEIAYLAGVDDAAMRGLIARELGPLAARDPHAARLRETLHAYLGSRRSPEATARLIGVHKNTVRYRIQRIEELLGRPIDGHSLALETALACVATYGPDALPD
ncbi:PucR family transcriptional regulator [Nocardia sp. NPDC127579]|uniref:PucR family transcriptional regulator n=1 Tax=Nocardia sp. NPDC127579 TaxID=3345402 RepID=UPI00364547E6